MADFDYRDMAKQTDPVTKLLEAVIRVNYYAGAARDAGWGVDLTASDGRSSIGVDVYREPAVAGWPSPITEGEAAP